MLLLEEVLLKIDCCLEGDSEVEVNVDEDVGGAAIGDDGGDNFISARFRLTPCSTGSNSSERLSEATANMMSSVRDKEKLGKREKK